LPLWQIGKRFSFDLLLGGIVPSFGDPAQLEATAVKARIRANASISRSVVPRNAQRDVAQGMRHRSHPAANDCAPSLAFARTVMKHGCALGPYLDRYLEPANKGNLGDRDGMILVQMLLRSAATPA
jgi:hypothetical protein